MLTSSAYSFTTIPNCGYSESITVTGLPNFANHNIATQDFTVSQTSDLSLIGVYPVTVTAKMDVPDDYLKSTFTAERAQFTFDLRIEPCQITSFKGIPKVEDISYTLGTPSAITGNYGFTQE